MISHTRSTDGGATWYTPVVARSFDLVRSLNTNCPHAQDQRCIRPFGPIAVDKAAASATAIFTPCSRTTRVARNVNHSDVYITKSANGGATWSAPVRVNDDGLPNNGDWAECTFSTAGVAALNKTGKTQLRIAFSTDDDNDNGDDYIGFYSSNNATAANHPQLVVTYQ